jgi:hypothetical protein
LTPSLLPCVRGYQLPCAFESQFDVYLVHQPTRFAILPSLS